MTGVYLYPINCETAPNYVIRKAFEKNFAPFREYDWYNIANKIGLRQAQNDFLAILEHDKPEYTFMQIQDPNSMSVDVIKRMAAHTKIINWTGDVRHTPQWYEWLKNIGKEIHLTLLTNEDDVKVLQAAGIRADYLQVGFDNVWYNRGYEKLPNAPEIVFCANAAPQFPLHGLRLDVIRALIKEFGNRFAIYGTGWDKYGIKTRPVNNLQEAALYNSAKIGISVSSFDLDRYHSDRLLRIMGCECMPMSHRYKGCEKDFAHATSVVYFDSIPHLVDTCNYYLANNAPREIIANLAYNDAHKNHNWDMRCQQLKELLKKYA